MNIASISNVADLNNYGINSEKAAQEDNNATFESMFQAAVNLVKDSNHYTSAAQAEETAFAMGLKDSTADLLIAQQKANMSLQYTIAVRNQVLDAYKEIMNLQF